ncbi:MAG: hypothetical protein AAF555_00110 [Verrucomicrobiota bacterium]
MKSSAPFFVCFAAALFSGCAQNEGPVTESNIPGMDSPAVEPEAPRPVIREVQVGVVRSVNRKGFVVIKTANSLALDGNASLITRFGEERRGKVRLSSQRDRGFAVADILEGEIEAGDPVFSLQMSTRQSAERPNFDQKAEL